MVRKREVEDRRSNRIGEGREKKEKEEGREEGRGNEEKELSWR